MRGACISMHRSTHSRGIITEKDNISIPKHIRAHCPHRRDNGKQFQDIDMGLISLFAVRLLKQPWVARGVIPCFHQPSGAFRIAYKPLTRGLINHDDAQPVSGFAEARIRVDQDLVSGSLLETKLQRWHVQRDVKCVARTPMPLERAQPCKLALSALVLSHMNRTSLSQEQLALHHSCADPPCVPAQQQLALLHTCAHPHQQLALPARVYIHSQC